VTDSLRLALAFLVACGATLLLTPLAIELARRTSFYDHPVGYKGHGRPTPYLGGIAVVAGALVAAAVFGHGADEFLPIAIGAFALLALGTIDDRHSLGPLLRLLIEVAAAGGLYAAGIGWSIFADDVPNICLTVLFVVGVVNAFNLMDNMDGATGAVAAVSGATLGMLAAAHGAPQLGAIALAFSGACMGFLRFNLASPARIFLGDGGSMPVGFTVAAVIMALPGGVHMSWAFIPVTVVLVGLPALDTTLVVVSRLRREVGVFTGGRDHLTHRLLPKVGSARGVALVLAVSQAIVCGLGAFLFGTGDSLAAAGSVVLILLGVGVVALLESPEWARTAGESSA
jgi:UDP-GlcNAc:undecaprenyl-phosphate GlcNAc-1-phosphate transferase